MSGEHLHLHITTRELLKARSKVVAKGIELLLAGDDHGALAHAVAAEKLTGLAKEKRQTKSLAEDLPKI